MKIKKYRNDHFISIRLSYVELVRLSRIIDAGVCVLKINGKDLPIDYEINTIIDSYFKTSIC